VCYKPCAKFSDTYTLRVGANKCQSSDGRVSTDNSYASGSFSVTDVFGGPDCTGYNVNDDSHKREDHNWNICPYDQSR
jgi:hypothetical protein